MIDSLGRHEGDVHWGLRCWKGLAWVVQFLIRGPVQGLTVGPDGLRPKPYTNRVESQGFMGGVMRNPASSWPWEGRVCPRPLTHAHITYKTSYKGKFSEKSDSCLHPHIRACIPPMPFPLDDRGALWTGSHDARTDGGSGNRANHGNGLLDNIRGLWYSQSSK